MLEVRFKDSATLKKIIDALRDFISEVNIKCDSSGLSLQAMDNGHVALADLKLDPSVFELFRCDRPTTLGVALESLHKMIRPAINGAPLTLRRQEGEEQLTLISEDPDEGGVHRSASLKLIDVQQDDFQVPEFTFDVLIEFPSKRLQALIRDLASVASNLGFRVNGKALTIDADGDMGRVENIFHKTTFMEKGNMWHFNKSDRSSSLEQQFSVRYLSHCTKACPLSDLVELSLMEGAPLRMRFPLDPDGTSYLSYYLAPKLE